MLQRYNAFRRHTISAGARDSSSSDAPPDLLDIYPAARHDKYLGKHLVGHSSAHQVDETADFGSPLDRGRTAAEAAAFSPNHWSRLNQQQRGDEFEGEPNLGAMRPNAENNATELAKNLLIIYENALKRTLNAAATGVEQPAMEDDEINDDPVLHSFHERNKMKADCELKVFF